VQYIRSRIAANGRRSADTFRAAILFGSSLQTAVEAEGKEVTAYIASLRASRRGRLNLPEDQNSSGRGSTIFQRSSPFLISSSRW
jgi:hypothetical protein